MQRIPIDPADDECREAEKEIGHTWEADQKRGGYYYDDAHGYQDYIPDDTDENEPDPPEIKKPGHDSWPGVNDHNDQTRR